MSISYLLLRTRLYAIQSNDEVSEVFVLMVDAGDDPLCYILEKWTFPPAEFASYCSSYTKSVCVLGILKSLWSLLLISSLHKP